MVISSPLLSNLKPLYLFFIRLSFNAADRNIFLIRRWPTLRWKDNGPFPMEGYPHMAYRLKNLQLEVNLGVREFGESLSLIISDGAIMSTRPRLRLIVQGEQFAQSFVRRRRVVYWAWLNLFTFTLHVGDSLRRYFTSSIVVSWTRENNSLVRLTANNYSPCSTGALTPAVVPWQGLHLCWIACLNQHHSLLCPYNLALKVTCLPLSVNNPNFRADGNVSLVQLSCFAQVSCRSDLLSPFCRPSGEAEGCDLTSAGSRWPHERCQSQELGKLVDKCGNDLPCRSATISSD